MSERTHKCSRCGKMLVGYEDRLHHKCLTTPTESRLRNQTKAENLPGIKALQTMFYILHVRFGPTHQLTAGDLRKLLKDTIEGLRDERHGGGV